MKSFHLLVVLLWLASNALAQPLFNTQISYENNEFLSANPGLIKTQDGGYLVLYWRLDDSPINFNKWNHGLVKFNKQGEILWEKQYDHFEEIFTIGGLDGLLPSGVKEMPDGRIVVAGTIKPDNGGYLYVTNSEGDSLLYRSYESSYGGMGFVTTHGEETISVVTADSLDNRKMVFIDINTGDVTEIAPFQSMNSKMVFPDNLEHYYNYSLMSDTIIRIEKRAYSGSLLLSTQLPTPEGFDLGPGPDSWREHFNNLYNGDGMVMYDNALLAIDEDLNPILSIPFNENSLYVSPMLNGHESNYVLPTQDGGYLLSGNFKPQTSPVTSQQVFFIKLDAQGNEEWFRIYANWELPSNYVPYMVEEQDGYVFIRHDYGIGKIFLTKINREGELITNTEHPEHTTLKVWPNPAQEELHLDIPEAYANSPLSIVNAQGQIISINSTLSGTRTILPLVHLVSGIYFLVLTPLDLPPLRVSFIKL